MFWLIWLFALLAARRTPYTRDEWLRAHGMRDVADAEAQDKAAIRREALGLCLIGAGLLIALLVGWEYLATRP